MVKVRIWGSLAEVTGSETVYVDGGNFIELLNNLKLRYPGLQPQIDRGVSLAIDGKIYKESWFTPVNEDSEVVLMPLMIGG
tara:strand:+ start:217 stop:459 length:243 start_codon:yes stop_codon:yes gene_type:complete